MVSKQLPRLVLNEQHTQKKEKEDSRKTEKEEEREGGWLSETPSSCRTGNVR